MSSRSDGVFTLVEIRKTWDGIPGVQHTPDEANAWFSDTLNMLLTRVGPREELHEADGEELACSAALLTKSFLEDRYIIHLLGSPVLPC